MTAKNEKINRENKSSFLLTDDSPEISERLANYIIRVNYPDFLSKKVTTNYLDVYFFLKNSKLITKSGDKKLFR